jgi:hypothetical protein
VGRGTLPRGTPGSIEPRQDPFDPNNPDYGFDPWQTLWFYNNPVFVRS